MIISIIISELQRSMNAAGLFRSRSIVWNIFLYPLSKECSHFQIYFSTFNNFISKLTSLRKDSFITLKNDC